MLLLDGKLRSRTETLKFLEAFAPLRRPTSAALRTAPGVDVAARRPPKRQLLLWPQPQASVQRKEREGRRRCKAAPPVLNASSLHRQSRKRGAGKSQARKAGTREACNQARSETSSETGEEARSQGANEAKQREKKKKIILSRG